MRKPAVLLLCALGLYAAFAVLGNGASPQTKPQPSGPAMDDPNNETAAIGVFRMVNTVEVIYKSAFKTGFSKTLRALGAPPRGGKPDKGNAGLVDDVLAGRAKGGTDTSFERKGYRFVYRPGPPDAKGDISGYTFTARPIQYGKTGKLSLYCDQTAIIRGTGENREATAKDPPL
jgi:hypothetical protein